MLNQFSRTELLFGKEAMEKLSNSRVAIFGIGGVGGYAVEALARSGVGELDLIDDDKVCLTNINRQIIATRKTVGKYKVDVAEERVHDICPDIKVNTYKCFYMPDTADQFDFTQYDYVIDAIDTVTGKLEIIKRADVEACLLYPQWVQATSLTLQHSVWRTFIRQRSALLRKSCDESLKRQA